MYYLITEDISMKLMHLNYIIIRFVVIEKNAKTLIKNR